MDKLHAEALLLLIAELYISMTVPDPEPQPEPATNGHGTVDEMFVGVADQP